MNTLDRPPCAVCGAPLVEAVTGDAIVTFDGQRIPFKRHTDFVMCQECQAMYRVEDLRVGRVLPVDGGRA